VELVIFVINIDLISNRCYCDINLNNGCVLYPFFKRAYFSKRLPEKQTLKFVYQVNTKGNTTKEPRKFIPLPSYGLPENS
jgi:hypothetical protein